MPYDRYQAIRFDETKEKYYLANVVDYECPTYQCTDDWTNETFVCWLTDEQVESYRANNRLLANDELKPEVGS